MASQLKGNKEPDKSIVLINLAFENYWNDYWGERIIIELLGQLKADRSSWNIYGDGNAQFVVNKDS
jgi:hypothetical protein